MYSMTGYGRGQLIRDEREITVEIRTVNNRYLDITCKLPKQFFPFEDAVRKTISASLFRGRAEVFVSCQDNREQGRGFQVDMRLAKCYIDSAKELSCRFGIENDLTASAIMRLPDVLNFTTEIDDGEILKDLLIECTALAVQNLNIMRAAEGTSLKRDLTDRLAQMRDITDNIAARAPEIAAEYKTKLTERMRQMLSGVDFDESRLLTEAAFFADKSNIDEELSRLYSHYSQFSEIIDAPGPAGRKLDFLVQELNRETNTVCSKSNDVGIAEYGLQLKAEIEKIREQVQNIE